MNPPTSKPYVFAEAVKFPSYLMEAGDDQSISAFHAKITEKSFNSMTEVDFYQFVSIALNVRDPVNKSGNIFTSGYAVEMLCDKVAEAKPSSSSKVPFTQDVAAGKVFGIIPTSIPQATATTEESVGDKAVAICFMYAWLTRFAVKMPSIVINTQYDKLRDTYVKFYQTSSSIFDNFRPDHAWLMCLRNAFDSFPRVKNMLVLYVSHSETKYKSDPKKFNILRYLFYQNLEFMGMHAYVSIVSIMNKVDLPPALILSWLRINGAEAAVDEAFHIMSTLDNGMIDGGVTAERLWKYARLLDQGYFNHLQTTYAADLMAMLAYIEIYLGISTETGYSSPLNIFAIANNKPVKETGKAKAREFIKAKNTLTSTTKGASVVDKMYAATMGSSPYEQFQESLMDVDDEVAPVAGAAKRGNPQEPAPEVLRGEAVKRARKDPTTITLPPPPPL